MNFIKQLIFPACLFFYSGTNAQQITGFWKGKIDGKKVEVKIVKNGDSLTGTSYYYESANSYRRYTIKGYFSSIDNSVVWWDDQLIEQKKGNRLFGTPKLASYMSIADFNCPGGTKMFLTGNASKKENEEAAGLVDLQKNDTHFFSDEWDDVIDNYTLGANDSYIIDSVAQIAFIKPAPVMQEEKIVEEIKEPIIPETVAVEEPGIVETPPAIITPEVAVAEIPAPIEIPPVIKEPEITPIPDTPKFTPVIPVPAIDEKFMARKKVILTEIPLAGDSIELRFYDNAEVDGDSIAIFLNGHLMQEHIRLTEKAYIIKLAVAELQQTTELIMVAENLGSIPPNTSYMVCYVDDKRYEARLESTEQTSAGIRFIHKPD
ncbi:hypothetical protein ACQ33O_08590 [Ferruginibacter sp. SUN002]|uniref:hypothetical protein n=1 Tax=Ferruginibacter sp. SUN002 TaxID=2937789 RepID=UPI003D36FA64